MFGSLFAKSSLAVAALSLVLTAFAAAEDAAASAPAAKSYPLDICLVSDDKLGEMGEPPAIVHEGQEVKFCCKHCIGTFKANPDKYLKKMHEEVAKKPATQPAAEADPKADDPKGQK